MKYLILLVLLMGVEVIAQSPAPSASPLPVVAVACEAPVLDPAFIPPAWLQSALLFVKNIPVVGPILIEVGKWAGFVASVLTAFAMFLIGLLKALQPMSKLAFVGPFFIKIIEFLAKALPYVKFLSMLNTQKEELKKA